VKTLRSKRRRKLEEELEENTTDSAGLGSEHKAIRVPDRALTTRQVCQILGIGKTRFYCAIVRDPDFPIPIQLGRALSLRYLESEVLSYLKSRPRLSLISGHRESK
jgi:predicted DNA-binding transcriptional regulator AlpA